MVHWALERSPLAGQVQVFRPRCAPAGGWLKCHGRTTGGSSAMVETNNEAMVISKSYNNSNDSIVIIVIIVMITITSMTQ